MSASDAVNNIPTQLPQSLYISTSISTSMKLKQLVWMNRSNGQKCVTIPKNCDIIAGDHVLIEKVPSCVSPKKKLKR